MISKPLPTIAIAIVVLTTAIVPSGYTKTMPCEEALKQLRDAERAVKLSDRDMTKVNDLEKKGIDRCNADDDERANGYFAKAMKVIAKK